MATTMDNTDLALTDISANSNIVVEAGSRLPLGPPLSKQITSSKLSRKFSACPPKVDADLRPFGTNIPSPLKGGQHIPPLVTSDWAASSQESNPDMIPPGAPGYDLIDNSVIPPTGLPSSPSDTQDVLAPPSGPFCPAQHLGTGDMLAEDTEDLDIFHEVQSTPPGSFKPIGRELYLKDALPSPDHFTVGAHDVTMEDGPKPRRKRRNQTKPGTSKKKVSKSLPGTSMGPTMEHPLPFTSNRPRIKPVLFENFWNSSPDYFVPNTPRQKTRANKSLRGEVPSTPLHMIPETDDFNAQAGMQAILATRPVHKDMASCLMAFATLIDTMFSKLKNSSAHGSCPNCNGSSPSVSKMERNQVTTQPARNGQTTSVALLARPGPAVEMTAERTPDTSILPVTPGAESRNAPQGLPEIPWTTVVSRRKPPAPVAPTLPKRPPPQQPNRTIPIPPRPNLPVIVIHPQQTTETTSAQLRTLLETKLSPHQLGVKILSCQPAHGNGLLVRTATMDMSRTLMTAINTHVDLGPVCQAREPRKRQPQILVYDVPPQQGDRDTAEVDFVTKLRSSNSLPDGPIRVLFRKKGRGTLQHWVLTVDPLVFKAIAGKGRLHWGFGSLKFREYLEPTRCYKCHRFGHLRSACSAPVELCSRCPGEHSYTVCPKETPVCRRCREYNARNKTGPRLPLYHTAISDNCPLLSREREEMRKQTDYGP
ncbi:hypothetical protein AVEN_165435-1 [Araneus ventricosus]|uniref:CCHC-type domain-containing protein n=1 Tax=Araneus ventricosus TaxID=182803 RepID=A0A4Y2ATA1_ARAVE|nr:hypothetical protein AVEN_165435-1 [Araneus ventricosus]